MSGEMKKTIRIGTRESLLAVAQAELLKQYIQINHPEYDVILVKMKTTGDKILDRNLDEIGGKGLFVKELDIALYEGRTDLSVHSLKDLPVEISEDFPILGYSRREEPRDVLVLPQGCGQLDVKKPIGTSSPGRRVQLRRIGPNDRISEWFTIDEMVPAAGQGILAVQGRKDFERSILEGFFDEDARWQALAERSFVSAFGGGCSSPIAAHASIKGNEMILTGMTAGLDHTVHKDKIVAPKQYAQQSGIRLAQKMAGLPQ